MLPPTTNPPSERRASERRACYHPCLVRFPRAYLDGCAGGVGAAGEIEDLSACGVRLLLRPHLPAGADLEVRAMDPGPGELPLARVVYCVPCGDRWRHGCALRQRLGDEELRSWVE